MDYQDIIKLQEESPAYSTGNNSHTLKHCMAAFYDNDSQLDRRQLPEEIDNPYHISFEQAIDYVQNYIDIIDAPLDDVISCFERLQCGQDLDKNILKKKILKRKHLLKRYRAKNRLPKTTYSFNHFPQMTTTQIIETEAQMKKKRNRVSAQISRDKKKQYFKELQKKNQQLEEQIIRARLQNEKLKKQAQKIVEPQERGGKMHSQGFNSKLTKLLIFLGIICLIGMLKQTLFSTTQSWSRYRQGQKGGQFSWLQSKDLTSEAMPKVNEFLKDSEVERELGQDLENKNTEQCIYSQGDIKKRRLCGQLMVLMERLEELKSNIEL